VAGGDVDHGVAVADAELGEDVGEVEFHGAFGDGEDGGDFLIGEASLDQLDDAALAPGEALDPVFARGGQASGELHVELEGALRDPVVAVGHSADGGDEAGVGVLVGEEAADAEEEEAANVVVGLAVVEHEGLGFGEADAEEAEKAVEGHGKGALVDDEGGDGNRAGERVLEEAVAGDELEVGVTLEEELEVARRQRMVLDHTDRQLGGVGVASGHSWSLAWSCARNGGRSQAEEGSRGRRTGKSQSEI